MIFSKRFDKQIDHVQKVLSFLYSAGATHHRKKCNFITYTFDYLRHIIRSKRLDLLLHTTAAIGGLKIVANYTRLKTSRLMHRLQSIHAQLCAHFFSSEQIIEMNPAKNICTASHRKFHVMKTPKRALISIPVQALPYSEGHIKHDTDA